MDPLKRLTVSILWVGALLFLAFFYLNIADHTLRAIPYSFLLLAPFGWNSFFGWIIGLVVSYCAARALSWGEPPLRRAIKWAVAVACVIVLTHATWVLFVVARGGL